MTINIKILGTSGAAPTADRGLPSVAVRVAGRLMLVDCGEGTQRQMLKYGTGFDVKDVFFTHLHLDHFMGIVSFLWTQNMTRREEGIHIYCPVSEGKTMKQAISFAGELNFPVEIHELRDGEEVVREGYKVKAFEVQHGRPALGYVIEEDSRPGKFNVAEAKRVGVPYRMYGLLQKGKDVTLSDGRVIKSEQVLGEARKGYKVVISGDTKSCENTIKYSQGADVLIHESTFGEGDEERAAKLGHSTSKQAAEVAKAAGVKRLILTHFSKRYSEDVEAMRGLVRVAREVFEASEEAFDGMKIELY